MSRAAYLVDGVRTPIGRYGGALAAVRPDDLAAHAISSLLARHSALDPATIDDVILGCANQAGEDNRNVARMALLLAGLPDSVPGTTINRLCGSGLDALASAARSIVAGDNEIVLAGGVESMSRAPFVMPKATTAFSRQAEIFDTTIGWRFVNPVLKKQYGIDSMPETAENVAADFSISREDQDLFASAQSAARREGRWPTGGWPRRSCRSRCPASAALMTLVEVDEHPRETSLEALAGLKTPFRDPGTVTAGNASGVNDGAAALLVMSGEAVERLGVTPLARIVGTAAAGVPPRIMGIGPVPATRKLLARTERRPVRHRRDRTQRGLRGPVPRSTA